MFSHLEWRVASRGNDEEVLKKLFEAVHTSTQAEVDSLMSAATRP